MNSDDWQRIEAAFQRAVGLDGAARSAFVDEFAVAHPELADSLRELLAADAEERDPLAVSMAASVESLVSETRDPWVGRTIGAWTITERLAGGGMGAVFLAKRADEQYTQTVAVKVMAAQLVATEASARFRAERQILANLNHPYIASLLDGGSTDDGLPYLVMEYVEGLPVDRYCDENRLSIERRLALFRRICEAVDYAHRNLVVHRDLKPSNILVDAAGNPKLLDFGIAKLLAADAFEQTMVETREGSRAMTPEYASPEQVRGQPISVATDVYALGVLLYRLITGQSPYGVSSADRHDYEAAILDKDPRRPSTVVTDPEAGSDAGALRGISVNRLQKRLAGDLDNIVLKALQKMPERRYATAATLATDIGRYLTSEPVEARGDDWAYKARKFVVRHAGSLAISAAVVATIATLIIYYTAQLADERDHASLAAAQATEVSDFLTALFESASPHESRGEQITAIDLLHQGRDRIEQLRDQPALQARLMRIMASSMTALDNLDESIPMLERALQMKEAEVPRDDIGISQVTHNLAEAYRQYQDLEKAEHYSRRSIEIAEREFGPTHANVAYLMARLGVILFDDSRPAEALEIEQRALDMMIANGDGESSSAVDTRGNMANALSTLGREKEAEALHRETIELSMRVDGEFHPNTVIRITNLGLVLHRLGKLSEAAQLFEENIHRADRVWGPDHSHVGFIYSNLGATLRELGRMDEAMAAMRKSADIARVQVGEAHIRYARRLNGIASVLVARAHYDEAEPMLTAAIAKATALEGADGRNATQLRKLLGFLYADERRFTEAEAVLRRVRAHDALLPSNHRLAGRLALARALDGAGKFAEAETLLQQTITAKEAEVGADNPSLLPFLAVAASHFRANGDPQRSLEYGRRIEAIADSDPEGLLWRHALALSEYGRTLRALGRDEAGPVLARAHVALRDVFGPADPRVEALVAAMR